MGDAEQFAVQHRAALVDDELHFHAFCLEMSDDAGRADDRIAGLFVVPETQVEIAREFSAMRQVIFHRLEQRYHMALHILRAASVYVAVVRQHCLEGVVFPAVLRGGDDVDVAEETPALERGIGALEPIDD